MNEEPRYGKDEAPNGVIQKESRVITRTATFQEYLDYYKVHRKWCHAPYTVVVYKQWFKEEDGVFVRRRTIPYYMIFKSAGHMAKYMRRCERQGFTKRVKVDKYNVEHVSYSDRDLPYNRPECQFIGSQTD